MWGLFMLYVNYLTHWYVGTAAASTQVPLLSVVLATRDTYLQALRITAGVMMLGVANAAVPERTVRWVNMP